MWAQRAGLGADGEAFRWAAHTGLVAQLREQITPCDRVQAVRGNKCPATLRRRGQPEEPQQVRTRPLQRADLGNAVKGTQAP